MIPTDTNLFIARLPREMLERAIKITTKALLQKSLSLHEARSLSGFLTFCTRVVRLGRVFMKNIWDFIASYPPHLALQGIRRIPISVVHDLEWWNKLLPTHNGMLFFDDRNREVVQLYTDVSLVGLGGGFLP